MNVGTTDYDNLICCVNPKWAKAGSWWHKVVGLSDPFILLQGSATWDAQQNRLTVNHVTKPTNSIVNVHWFQQIQQIMRFPQKSRAVSLKSHNSILQETSATLWQGSFCPRSSCSFLSNQTLLFVPLIDSAVLESPCPMFAAEPLRFTMWVHALMACLDYSTR